MLYLMVLLPTGVAFVSTIVLWPLELDSCVASHQRAKESRTGFIASRDPCSEIVAAGPKFSFVGSANEPKFSPYSETSYRPPDAT